MNHIYFMIGVPGSGKSTVAKNIAAGRVDYICPDDIRIHVTGVPDNFSQERTVWGIVHQRVAHDCRVGKNIILDATGANAGLRRKMVAFMKGFDSFVHAVYCKVPVGVAQARVRYRALNGGRDVPDAVIVKMWQALDNVPPSRFDGFDQIDVIQ